MSDGGVSLSLDEYIKGKRRQGGFKVRRGGGGAAPGSGRGRQQQQQRGGNRKGRGGKGNSQRGGQQRLAAGQGQKQQRGNRQPVKGLRYFNANLKQIKQEPNIRKRSPKVRGTNRNSLSWRGRISNRNQPRGQQNIVLNPSYGNLTQRRGINRRGRGGRVNISRSTPMPLMNANFPFSNAIRRGQNAALVKNRLKLAKKRIQRARNNLVGPRVVVGIRNRALPVRGLELMGSGIRKSRNGFVTVKNPVEKQLQQMVIQQKIARARQARGKSATRGNRNQNRRAATTYAGIPALRVQIPNNRRRPPNRPRISSPVEQYEPYLPRSSHGEQYEPYVPRSSRTTLYSDELSYGASRRQDIDDRWNEPIVRTTLNNNYQPAAIPPTSSQDYDYLNRGLNPEIQKKITFIQTRARGRVPETRVPTGIIPDFRAPIASSSIKLGDRFRMYMQ